MSTAPEFAAIARDPLWLPHRYDELEDAVHFLRLTREQHRGVTFITDEHLPADAQRLVIRRSDATAGLAPAAPVHFVFHSAYCCSTLIARALDVEGVATTLKEPVILNDMVGWKRRGAEARQLGMVVDDVLTLLAQPFEPGEAVVIKPSNLLNVLAMGMLGLRPDSRALLLHAPLPDFLASVAKKGLWGRRWVRELFIALLAHGIVDLGLEEKHYLDLTDLQVAAAGWLAQHALFMRMIAQFGPTRVRTIDSATLLARPGEAMAGLSDLFGLGLAPPAIDALVAGAFGRHSKFDAEFTSADREAEQRDTAQSHGDEIEKVAAWADAVAAGRGIPMGLGAPLLP
jgi:hypothetical protein